MRAKLQTKSWNVETIGDLPIGIGDGNYSSKYPKRSDFRDSGVPFVSNKDIKHGRILRDGLRYISNEQHQSLRKGHIKEGDVLVSTRANIGDIGWVNKYFDGANINAQLVYLRADEKALHGRYLFYLLSSQEYKGLLQGFSSGSAQSQLPIKSLVQIPIRFPSLDIQIQIADVLSTYDDLIENNTRRIEILEEMAQAIYKEWFVKLRFPGHEKVKFVDNGTEFGKILEGWEVRDLYSIADVKTGYPFASKSFTVEQEGFKAVRIRDILAGSTAVYTSEEVDDSYIVRKGDFLIGMDGIFHMNHWHDRDSYLVQRVCRVRAKEERLRAYVALALYQPIKYLESTLSGSTVSHLGTRHLREIKVVVPDEDFDGALSIFNSFLDLKLNYANQNVLLRQARDLLLPKLVTGEVWIEPKI